MRLRIKKVEQTDQHTHGRNRGYHRYLKREQRRIDRRIGKRYLDAAPTKRAFRGYET